MSRGLMVVGALLSLAAAIPARAQTPERRGMLPIEGAITHPDWTHIPSGDDVNTVYPAVASSLRASGRAEMQCEVRTDGKVENCVVVEETPPGLGFGEAALKLSDKFEMRPELIDGKAVGGAKVNIPIRFKMDLSMDAREAEAAPEPPLSQTQMVLVRRLAASENLEAHQRELVDKSIAQFSEHRRPQLAGAALAKFDEEVAAAKSAIYASIPEEVEKNTIASVRGLSDTELKTLIAFFESPTGRKWEELNAGAVAREREAVIQSDFWRSLTIRLCAVSSCAGS